MTTMQTPHQSEDADCDGVLTDDDCDDADAASTTRATDADCDGVLTETDCDDNDLSLGDKANDFDCDGVHIEADCDDNDASMPNDDTDAMACVPRPTATTTTKPRRHSQRCRRWGAHGRYP